MLKAQNEARSHALNHSSVLFISSPFEGEGLFEKVGFIFLETTMVSVLHKEYKKS